MKTPFVLHKRADTDTVRGLLLLSEEPADLLALFAQLGCDPVPDAFAVAGGFLLKLTEPTRHAFPQTIRLRCLSSDLFLPADADLLPPLLDDEAAALVRDRGLIFLPGGRVLAYQPDQPLALSRLLQIGGVQRGEWVSLPEPAPQAERLHEILLDRPDESPDDMLQSGGDDIGGEEPLPDDASTSDTVRAKASLGLGKAFVKLGEALGWKGLSNFGANLIQGALDRVPQLGKSILGAQEAALRALLREFRDGNLEKALRRALPIGGETGRGSVAADNAQLPTHDTRFSLKNVLGSGRGGASLWFGGGDVQTQLAAEYRKAAQEATARGDYRRAAFIYAKLLQDYRSAADVLSRGGLHHEAAILYLDKVGDNLAAARSFEAAGEFDRALRLYRQLHDHLRAAELLRKTGEEEAAIAEFLVAADELVRKQNNHLAAGELLLERAGRTDLALDYFHRGWAQRPQGMAVPCLIRLAPLHADEPSPDALLALLAEADDFFAPPGQEAAAGPFYNEVARLADRPRLANLRDDLRDRALIGLSNKLRQRIVHEEEPGPQAAALFGRSDLWAPAQVNDAEFAYKAALRPTRRPTPKTSPTPTRTFLGSGQITAVCAAADTGQVFIGFEGGRLLCFDPQEKTTVPFPLSERAVRVMTADATGSLIVTLRDWQQGYQCCVSYTRDEHGLFVRGVEKPGLGSESSRLSPITRGLTGAPILGYFTGREFILLEGRQPAAIGQVADKKVTLGKSCAFLLFPMPNKDGSVGRDVQVLSLESNGFSWWHVWDRPTGSGPLGFACQPTETLGGQAHLLWANGRMRRHLEIARINRDSGGVYWARLHFAVEKWYPEVAAVAAGHSSYQAVTFLGPGRLAAVREGRIVWLRHAGKWLVPWSTQDISLSAAHACFFSPCTNELTVITRDNHAVCVPVPNG